MPRKHSISRKTAVRKFWRYRPFAAALLVILAVCLLYLSYSYFFAAQTQWPQQNLGKYSGINLNISDISSVIQGTNYVPLNVDQVAVPSQNLQRAGYYYVSVSSFNAALMNVSSTYPATISSSVFILNSSTMANRTLYRIVNANIALNVSGHVMPDLNYTEYAYGGKSVRIYCINSINVLSSTGIADQGTIPIFESLSVFDYNNIVGSVALNGYANQNKNISLQLAEKLFIRIVSSSV